MRKWVVAFLLIVCLIGCSGENELASSVSTRFGVEAVEVSSSEWFDGQALNIILTNVGDVTDSDVVVNERAEEIALFAKQTYSDIDSISVINVTFRTYIEHGHNLVTDKSSLYSFDTATLE